MKVGKDFSGCRVVSYRLENGQHGTLSLPIMSLPSFALPTPWRLHHPLPSATNTAFSYVLPSLLLSIRLGFRDMHTPRHHRTSPPYKQPHHRMHLQPPNAQHPPKHPVLPCNCVSHARGHGHRSHNTQTRRYGETFKVFAFPGGVFRERGDGNVEARKTRETA